MYRVILRLDIELDGQWSKFPQFSNLQANRKCHLVTRFCFPIDEHIRIGSNAPSIPQKVNKGILGVHLFSCLTVAAHLEPLLGKNVSDEMLASVPESGSWSTLPVALTQLGFSCCGEDERWASCQQPVPHESVTRR